MVTSEIERLTEQPLVQLAIENLNVPGGPMAPGEGLRRRHVEPLKLGSLWGSSQALLTATLQRKAAHPLIVLLPDPEEAELFSEDLRVFGAQPILLPCLEASRGEPESLSARLGALQAIAAAKPTPAPLFVTSILASIQPVPSPERLQRSMIEIRGGARFSAEELSKQLRAAHYREKPMVAGPGDWSWRGAIFDLFPLSAQAPVRIEHFEGKIESLRTFDPETQRSKQAIERYAFALGEEPEVSAHASAEELFLSYFHGPFGLLRIEPLRAAEKVNSLRLQEDDFAKRIELLEKELRAAPCIELHSLPTGQHDFGTLSVQALSAGSRSAAESLRAAAAQTPRIFVFCRTEAEQKRLGALLTDQGLTPGQSLLPTGDGGTLELPLGSIAAGFRLPAIGASFLNHHELLGIPRTRRPGKLRQDLPTQAIRSFLDLKENDLVVHEVHGVGRFLGVQRVKKGQGEEDHLLLEFADEAHLFVPSSRIDLVQKYIGAGGVEPHLDKIGSGSFLRRKENVQRALVDLAAELLEVQALRQSRQGISYPEDDEMQRDMEAAFPFPETEDQTRITREIKADLQSTRPMDRLLCGDVGYGKTELAVRAAFKVVSAGKQAAVLVPTTILAEQHGQTFRERLADYPVRIESLSRFRTEKEQRRIVEDAAAGKVDILIGTHRILSNDVTLPDLGLVVIDEEQRFGVQHKEKLKQLRATVDVLTLTATPIPRTLHMALVGIRDISSLTTPPMGRESVETLLRFREDDRLIQEAIRREINRGGQVFFLHNRVQTIHIVAERLRKLVPEARYGVGHGQMGERELEEVMADFVAGRTDVLVTTAIIESGLDIPRANTILIDNAHLFGLSDLHQLRGRVGRWKHKAHCLLLIPRTEPLPAIAKARLKAIEEFQELGSGFSISMRDLEIRGAGNLLGPEQSGHIGAVGYDMYCRLLKATVERMGPRPQKRAAGQVSATPTPGATISGAPEAVPADLDLGVSAFLSESYCPDKRTRLGLLRELDEIHDRVSREKAEADLRDRFGPVPEDAKRLLDLFWIKRFLGEAGVRAVHRLEDRLLVEYRDRLKLSFALRAQFPDIRYVEEGKAHAMIPAKSRSPERVLALLCQAAAQGAEPGTAWHHQVVPG